MAPRSMATTVLCRGGVFAHGALKLEALTPAASAAAALDLGQLARISKGDQAQLHDHTVSRDLRALLQLLACLCNG